MRASNWSPYPWEARESGGGVFDHVAIKGKYGNTGKICELIAQGDGKYDYRVTNANAHVLAAAPELYEACVYMHRLLTDMGHGGLAGAVLGANAIAKARGEA